MMRTVIASLIIVLVSLSAWPVLANGYDIHAAPLAWSPDGKHVAAAVSHAGINSAALVEGELRLHDRFGNFELLAGGLVGSPSFSPDGTLLAAIVDGNVVVFDLMAGTNEPLTSGGDALDCAWGTDSATGAPVLNYSQGERFYGSNMYSLLWERGELIEWPKALDGGSALGVKTGPGGAFIAYLWQPGFDEIQPGSEFDHAYERVRLRGPGAPMDRQATARQWREWDYHECNPVFLAEDELIMQRGGWGEWDLYVANLETGREHHLAANAQHPTATTDGRYVAFSRWTDFYDQVGEQPAEQGVWLLDRKQRREHRLSEPGFAAGLPTMTADGLRIAWLEEGYEGVEVQIRSLRGITYPYEAPAPKVDPVVRDTPKTEPMVSRVVMETTRGEIVLAVHHDWAPIGAARFIELIEAGYYTGAPWFRVLDGFVAQCGIAADPAVNLRWEEDTITDDPVVKGNLRGFVAFGKTGEPNSRTTHIYINYGDNSRLDANGFACFAEVVEGMAVADTLTRCEFDDQGALAVEGGMAAFAEMFPAADYILRAYVAE